MHLVLRSDTGESITLEVLQEDTFEDLSNRLYERGKISVDLKQLRTDSRPFEMTANVMDYFGAKKGIRRKENQEKGSVLEEASNAVSNDSTAATSTKSISASGTTTVTTVTTCNESAYTTCVSSVKTSSNTASIESSELIALPNENPVETDTKPVHQDLHVDSVKSKDEVKSNHIRSAKYCRLCACPIKDEAKFIFEASDFEESSDAADTLADKINEALPILVSKEDELPKQVCLSCVESLNASHAFTRRVTAADDLLKKMLYQRNFEIESTGEEHEEKCPLCCEGSMKVVPVEELPSVKEEACPDSNEEDSFDQPWGNGDLDADDYDEYDDDENSYSQPKKRGRPRGSRTSKRQYPWDDLDDEDWTMKEETVVKKRGRPKGSKNKSNQQEQPTQCCLCLTWHSDLQAILAHTLEVHCEDETGTFPCPLCKAIQPDEGELIHHVTNHNHIQPPIKVKMWGCPLCGQVYEGHDELGNHLLSDHVQAASPQYQCPLCDHAPTSGSRLANHITDSHCGPPTWNCPLCDEGHEGKQTALDHVVRSHVSVAAQTTQCPLCEMQFITDEEMAQHLLDRHTTTHIVERPAHYTCTACNSRFKSQYTLVKHTCPAVDNSQYCSECNVSFPSKMRHVFHLQFHQDGVKLELRCDFCLAEFDDETNLYDHIRFCHEPSKQWSCSVCQQLFKTELELHRHQRKHHFRIRHHKCEECGAKFLNAQTLKEHSVSHMDVKPYQCTICGAQLSRLSRLRLHLRNHSVQTSSESQSCFQCSLCFQVFPSEELIFKHCMQEHKEENSSVECVDVSLLYRCEFCDGCFCLGKHLIDHYKTNHPDPTTADAYTCRICGSAFPSYAQVTTHKLSHGLNTEKLILRSKDEKPALPNEFNIPQYFVCEVCGKKCLHYTYLSMHRKQHSQSERQSSQNNSSKCWSPDISENNSHNILRLKSSGGGDGEQENKERRERKVECPICKRRYSSEETLEVHMRIKHTPGTPTAKPYMCDTCGKTFAFKSAWQAHCDAHNGVKQYGCTECDKRFTHKAGLIKHMHLHSSDRPYLCEFCGKKFRDCTERNNHVRAHTGERPFMCEVCGRAFHTRAVLLDHSRIHRDERPYRCDICGTAFRRSFALKSHKLIHTGQRPFHCADCGRDFRLKQSLVIHQKKEHKGYIMVNSNINHGRAEMFILEETEYETVDDEDDRVEMEQKEQPLLAM